MATVVILLLFALAEQSILLSPHFFLQWLFASRALPFLAFNSEWSIVEQILAQFLLFLSFLDLKCPVGTLPNHSNLSAYFLRF